jgi:hypothetical protein
MDEFPFTRGMSGNFPLPFLSTIFQFYLLLTRPSHRRTPATFSHLLLVNLRTRRDNCLAARRLLEKIIR